MTSIFFNGGLVFIMKFLIYCYLLFSYLLFSEKYEVSQKGEYKMLFSSFCNPFIFYSK